MLHIVPEDSPTDTFARETHQKIAANLRKATSIGNRIEIVEAGRLLAAEHDVIKLATWIASKCSPNVVLDISTIPKRFFFPLLTLLTDRSDLSNLIVANTYPNSYGKDLAGSPEEWMPLPMYVGDPVDTSAKATMIISVGYQKLGIHAFLEQNKSREIIVKLLLPFPSIHPGFIDNWKFVQGIKQAWDGSRKTGNSASGDIIRVPLRDVSLTFDLLLRETESGLAKSVILAPFGPKPVSLAMCLLGIARRARGDDPQTMAPLYPTEIGYTQPKMYRPDYSTGVAVQDGHPDVAAYCVRLQKRDLYTLP
jgi:hypothetical protein